jgi:hypothetical protein
MRVVSAIVGLIISSASGVFGATVQLDDGRALDGDVFLQTPAVIVLNAYDGNSYEIQRIHVTWFSSDTVDHAILAEPVEIACGVESGINCAFQPNAQPANPASEPQPRVTTPAAENAPLKAPVLDQPPPAAKPQSSAPVAPRADEEPIPASFSAPLVVPPFDFPQPATEAQGNALRDAIPQLSDSADPTDRTLAEDALRSAGPVGLSALLKYGLYSPIPSVRTRAANLFSALGGRSVLKHLIEAFYSGAYPTIAPYQVAYIETLATNISRLTGKDFFFYARRSSRAPEVANAMVAWWNDNWRNLPAQLGEPKLDPARADYEALLREVRKLNLIHREFPGGNLPSEALSPPLPPTPAEQQFLNTIPVVPRDSINNSGPRVAADQQPVVVKEPAPSRDEPGQIRQQIYLDRLKELEAR